MCIRDRKVAIIAERIGGQVKETVGIENLISIPYTTGSQLADNLRTHLQHYPIEMCIRDRSMAGRVMVKSDKPLKPATQFINFDRPLLEIPHIAIHFNRAVNDQGNPLSKQRDMLPVIAMINETFEKDNFLLKLIAQEMNIPAEDILDFDLTLYEYGKGTLFGLNLSLIHILRQNIQ